MTYKDVEILNQSLGNVGDALLRERLANQQYTEKQASLAQDQSQFAQKMALEQAGQKQSAQQFKEQQKPKIKTSINNPENNLTYDFTGTQEQLDAVLKANPKLKASNSSNAYSLKIGGADIKFDNENDYNKAIEEFNKKGINPFDEKWSRYGRQGTAFEKEQERLNEYIEDAKDAQASGDMERARHSYQMAQMIYGHLQKTSTRPEKNPLAIGSRTTTTVADPMHPENKVSQTEKVFAGSDKNIGTSGLPDFSQLLSSDVTNAIPATVDSGNLKPLDKELFYKLKDANNWKTPEEAIKWLKANNYDTSIL